MECPGCYPYYNKTALNRVYHGVTNSLMAIFNQFCQTSFDRAKFYGKETGFNQSSFSNQVDFSDGAFSGLDMSFLMTGVLMYVCLLPLHSNREFSVNNLITFMLIIFLLY